MPQAPITNSLGRSQLRQEAQALAHALTFLTRLSVPAMDYQRASLGRSVVYFPLVGVEVGLIGGAAYQIAAAFWPTSVAVVITLGAMIASTGGFHEDGLADSADGLGGVWTSEDKLRIMKDSRIGVYGSLALVLALLLKFAVLSAMPAAEIPAALLAAHVLARWSILPLLRYCPYLGGDSGTGSPFVDAVKTRRFVVGTASAWLMLAVVVPGSAWSLIVIASAVTALSGWYCTRALGGVTGDTLGATNQLIEMAVYLALAATV